MLRDRLRCTGFAELRTSCRVYARDELEDAVHVSYETRGDEKRVIGCRFLVGADGKRGVVRKSFLEPKGIKQDFGLYANEFQCCATSS